MSKEQWEFVAEVLIAGINPWVEVPRRVAERLGGGSRIPVLVRITCGKERGLDGLKSSSEAARLLAMGRLTEQGWFRTTLLRSRTGSFRLYLDQWMRKWAQAQVGAQVRVTLRADLQPREVAIPPLLQEALEGNPEALKAWQRLPPSRRKEILVYLQSLKTPQALARNVQKAIARLLGKGKG